MVNKKQLPQRHVKKSIQILESLRRGKRPDIADIRALSSKAEKYSPTSKNPAEPHSNLNVSFRILYDKLPLNLHLSRQQERHKESFQIQTPISPLCPVCEQQEESLQHFYTCSNLPDLHSQIRAATDPLIHPADIRDNQRSPLLLGFIPRSFLIPLEDVWDLQ